MCSAAASTRNPSYRKGHDRRAIYAILICSSIRIFSSSHQVAASTVGILMILHGHLPSVSFTDLLTCNTPCPLPNDHTLVMHYYLIQDCRIWHLNDCKRGQGRALYKRTADWNAWTELSLSLMWRILHRIRSVFFYHFSFSFFLALLQSRRILVQNSGNLMKSALILFVPSYIITVLLVLSSPPLPYALLCCPVLCCAFLPCPALSYAVLSSPVLSCTVLFESQQR